MATLLGHYDSARTVRFTSKGDEYINSNGSKTSGISTISLGKLTDYSLWGDEKNTREIKYSLCEFGNDKDLRLLANRIDEGIIYNVSSKKFYAAFDYFNGKRTIKRTTLIARNKSGKELTDEYFGDNMTHMTLSKKNKRNNTVDNSTTASKGQAQNIKAFEKRILALETKIESLKTGAKGEKGEQGPKGEVGATGERGLKGEPGSSSVDTDIITGISSRISRLENAVVLNQKRPSSSPNNNNINYYLNRNYEDTQSIYTELSGIYGRLAASEESISSTYNTDSNLDLLSLITALTGRVEALEG